MVWDYYQDADVTVGNLSRIQRGHSSYAPVDSAITRTEIADAITSLNPIQSTSPGLPLKVCVVNFLPLVLNAGFCSRLPCTSVHPAWDTHEGTKPMSVDPRSGD